MIIPTTGGVMGVKARDIVLLMAAAAFAVLAWLGSDVLDRAMGSGVSSDGAWQACKKAIRSELSSQESAEFSLMSTDFAAPDGDSWLVTGTFDFKDESGIESERQYACEVDNDGDTSLDVTE